MKWLTSIKNDLGDFLFPERFSFFDFLAIIVIIEVSKAYSLWWLLAILPATLVSTILTVRHNRNKE